MEQFLDDWGLTVATFLPAVGAVVMLVIPRKEEEIHKLFALVISLVTAAIGIALFVDFNYDDAGTLQYVIDESWIDIINSRYILGLDGMSLPLIALTMAIVPLCIIYSWNHFPEPKNPNGAYPSSESV